MAESYIDHEDSNLCVRQRIKSGLLATLRSRHRLLLVKAVASRIMSAHNLPYREHAPMTSLHLRCVTYPWRCRCHMSALCLRASLAGERIKCAHLNSDLVSAVSYVNAKRLAWVRRAPSDELAVFQPPAVPLSRRKGRPRKKDRRHHVCKELLVSNDGDANEQSKETTNRGLPCLPCLMLPQPALWLGEPNVVLHCCNPEEKSDFALCRGIFTF